MNLFELKNHALSFSPQALSIKVFKEIWDNDPCENKSLAIKELSYVYYMSDDRSDYMYELDEDLRHEGIVKALDLEQWSRPTYIDDAMEYYVEMSETTSTKLLRSTRAVIQKVSEFLDVIDPNERDPRTHKPVFNLAQIVSSIEKMPKLVKALSEVESEVIKEKEAKAQAGSRTAGVNDDYGI